MVFNSFAFIVYFTVVTLAHFSLPYRARWVLLLVASCFFYMFFVPIYILILFGTIVIDYAAGIWIEDTENPRKKKLLLSMSIVSVTGVLIVFKYFTFLNGNVAALAAMLGLRYPIPVIRMILPIGLSFHTFQSLSYVIEVYRGKQKAERHFGIYALYVMYFPQLVAGPIERPQNLLHQFNEPRPFDATRVRDGLSLALWGLFKKVAVADTLAIYVNAVYARGAHHTGPTILLATYFFAFQIYYDFSGYTDIARGVSRVYGVDLMKNFETPYFSRTVSEFWSRWHISLSTWFRDYVYVPLGGNRVGLARNFANLLFVFLLSGFWHGANWTFVIWGGLNGVFLIFGRLWAGVRKRFSMNEPAKSGALRQALSTLFVFHLILLSWVFFRASSVGTAMVLLKRIVTVRGPIFSDPVLAQGIGGILVVTLLEVWNRRTDYWDNIGRFPFALRSAYSLALLFGVVLFGVEKGSQFIYFQF